jgi:hypothetical protein
MAIAARLKESGQEISILARGQRLADIREHGIILEEVSSDRQSTTRVKVVEQLEPEDAYDLVVVMMPKHHLSEILPILAANQHTPRILFIRIPEFILIPRVGRLFKREEMAELIGHADAARKEMKLIARYSPKAAISCNLREYGDDKLTK